MAEISSKKLALGYVSILVRDSTRQLLVEWRRRALDIDVRLERCLISAAVSLGIERGWRPNRLPLESLARGVDGYIVGFTPVLIRREVREALATYVRNHISINSKLEVSDLERLTASALVEMVLDERQHHRDWVALGAQMLHGDVMTSFARSAVWPEASEGRAH